MAFTHVAALLLMLAVVTVAADNYVEGEARVETPHVRKRISKAELAIEGQIFCKSHHTNYSLQGAKVKLVCPVVDSYGKLMGKFTISSYSTDVNGYFFFILYGLSPKLININGCKVKLDHISTLISNCKIPTNLNNGITGASLSSTSYKLLSHMNLEVYTVGPFYFSSNLEARKSIYRKVLESN